MPKGRIVFNSYGERIVTEPLFWERQMPKGRIVFNSYGERIVTEPYDRACADAAEISAIESITIPDGMLCDICGEEIVDPPINKRPTQS